MNVGYIDVSYLSTQELRLHLFTSEKSIGIYITEQKSPITIVIFIVQLFANHLFFVYLHSLHFSPIIGKSVDFNA